tara:strand:- start:506 stop:1048 length:543 start_codon:yes stop_codon:yes gene_type:complete
MERLLLERIIREEVELIGEDFTDRMKDLKSKFLKSKKQKRAKEKKAAQAGEKPPKEFYKQGPFKGHEKGSLSFGDAYKFGRYETMIDQGYSHAAAMQKLWGDKPPEPPKKTAAPEAPESAPEVEAEPEAGSWEDLFGKEGDSEPTSAADIASKENDDDFDFDKILVADDDSDAWLFSGED